MNMLSIVSLLLFGLLSLTGCRSPATTDGVIIDHPAAIYQTISPENAKKALDADPTIILLDVRTPQEFRDGHIPNSILLPDYQLGEKAAQLLPNKEAKIIIYCRSGRRSKLAALQLLEMGYRYVYDLGGIIDWPYDVVKGE